MSRDRARKSFRSSRAPRARAPGWLGWLVLAVVALFAVAASHHADLPIALTADGASARGLTGSEPLVAVSPQAKPAVAVAAPAVRERLPVWTARERAQAFARSAPPREPAPAADKYLNFLRFKIRWRVTRNDSDEPPIG